MYKIPDHVDFYKIKGKFITQIGFGSNFITFFFDGDFIQTSGFFEYTYSGNTYEYTEIYPLSNDLGLLRLLDKKITNVSYIEDNFILEFSNGSTLAFKSVDMYESYSIYIDGRRIII